MIKFSKFRLPGGVTSEDVIKALNITEAERIEAEAIVA